MKTLKLVCDCGKQREFRGESVIPILAEIDAAEWEEEVRDGKPVTIRQGVIVGICPDCRAVAALEV